jgi:lysophospholipase L1-like esterase
MLDFNSTIANEGLVMQGERIRTVSREKCSRPVRFVISVCGGAVLVGCGMSVVITVRVPATKQQQIGAVTNFGDSITCGYFADPVNGTGNVHSTAGYAGLLDAAIGQPSVNLCRASDQAVDMSRLWVPSVSPAATERQLYTVMIGTNDALFCGGSSGCLGNWQGALTESLAWLALPLNDKITGNLAASGNGAWSPDLSFGAGTDVNGATISFPMKQSVAGRALYVAYRVFNPDAMNCGTASLTIDGSVVALLNAAVPTGQALNTPNGTPDALFVATVPLGAVGSHTVSLSLTSATGTFFSFQWAGVASSVNPGINGGPRVLVGSVPSTTSKALNQTVAVYNLQLTELVAQLVADGMNVQIAPTASVLDPARDLVDEVHPNNIGHGKLAEAFALSL